MALALPRIQGFPCLAEIATSLYQSDTAGIGCAAAGSCNGMPQSRRDDLGQLKSQTGRHDAHHRNGKAVACQIDAVGLDTRFLQTLNVQLDMTLASVASVAKCVAEPATGCGNVHWY
jgi:hypothetical protein